MKKTAIHKKALASAARFVPSSAVQSRLHRRIFRQFADKLDFVYFGYVDQRDDDHQVVRGITLSPTHRDNHYSVGTYHGYDITMLERVDTIKQPGAPDELKHWLIMTADLHRGDAVPHSFIGMAAHSATFYRHVLTKFAYLQKINPGAITPYDPRFSHTFSMYTAPTYAVAVEQIFGGTLQQMLIEHFAQFSFEIHESTLYVYSEHKRPTSAHLSQMLQCAAWLANEIDTRDI